VKQLPNEVYLNDLMLGDRRTFMGETSIRVLEKRLGIQRDATLTYQNSYRNTTFNSGYYNNSAVRGGYNNNPNSGIPFKRNAEPPTYNIGRQSHDQHKRVKTGNDHYDMGRQQPYDMGKQPYEQQKQSYDPFDPFGRFSRQPQQHRGRGQPERGHPGRGHQERGHPGRGHPGMGYPPSPYGNQMYPNNLPRRDPNERANLRPPPTTHYSNFDNERPPARHSIQDKRDKKNDDANRFSGFDNK
jgi:hypothetical protein